MKIAVLHNAYQNRGGEDAVAAAEVDLLRSAGHDVHYYYVSNDEIVSFPSKAAAFLNAPYDEERRKWAHALVRETGAEVVHLHNFFPILTPAVHQGAAEAGAAVVQTLHNYRLLCSNGLFLRDGRVCEKCLNGPKLWGIVHRCYRASAIGSLAVARMQWRAERMQSWAYVDRFIALSEFARKKFISGGFSPAKIDVKPNFVVAPPPLSSPREKVALFVGRLSPEKGGELLLDAWSQIPDETLLIAGDGPERRRLEARAPKNVKFLGQLPAAQVQALMASSSFLVVPSVWNEPFGLVVIEALSNGLPVLASKSGALPELVPDGAAGLLFDQRDTDDLASKARYLFSRPDVLEQMSLTARTEYENHYTARANLRRLEEIYAAAIQARRSHSPSY